MFVAFGGNRSSGPLDVATSCLANASPHGRQDFASETFVTCFHPTQDPISSSDGSAHAVSTGSGGGCATHAVCVTGQRSHALTNQHGATEYGTGRWTPIVTHEAVAFKPSHFTRGKDGRPAEVTPPLSADADKGDQDTIVAAPLTKAKRAQSNTDDESWVPGEVAPTQNQFDRGDTRATTVVAFTQNSRDEVRLINDDGRIAGSIGADGGMHQTNYLAFANRTRDGIKVPEVMKDGVVPALTNPGGGGRSDAVNVASAMQVRRLTPTECAYLQGFPADYLAITFRKKPAADGPKYRALGNSMAVPCMWWLGMRIHEATCRDI